MIQKYSKVLALVFSVLACAIGVSLWGWDSISQFAVSLVAAAYLGFLFYNPQKSSRNVHYVGKASTAYSNLVLAGFQDQLSDETKLIVHRPDNGNFENADWQVSTIKKIPKNKLDALVLVPAGNSQNLIDTVIDLCRARIPVVLIDYKFRNQHFMERGLLPPNFVYADPIETGNLLGSVLEARVRQGVTNLVLMLGHGKSAVALFRTQAMVLRALQAAQSQPLRISLVKLDAWEFDAKAQSELSGLLERIVAAGEEVIVACPNDAILDEIDRHLPESHFGKVELMGCDGSRRQDGRLILDTSRHGIATVDINPREQGATAADLVNMRIEKNGAGLQGYHVRRVTQKAIYHQQRPR